MRKKLNIFVAVVLAMTLMFGSTLCYAAEAAVEPTEGSRAIARTQSHEVSRDISGDNGASFKIMLSYQWDEGYAGWFTDVALVEIQNAQLLSFTHTEENRSCVTVRIEYKDNTGTERQVSATYSVDEYGDVS
ncbi:MAG: hypothetical protein ACI4R6_02855 [Lachnospiraceae bacterium]